MTSQPGPPEPPGQDERKLEGRFVLGIGQGPEVVSAPADQNPPRGEDQEDSHNHDGAHQSLRHDATRVGAFLGERDHALPAGEGKDREDHSQGEQARVAHRVGRVERGEIDAARAGHEQPPTGQEQDDAHFQDAQDYQRRCRDPDAPIGHPESERGPQQEE